MDCDATHLTQRVGHDGQRSREHGFTLVEMVVAMLIMAVLAAAVILLFHGARRTSAAKAAQAAGASYSGAISAFKLDHVGRVPTIGNANDWPVVAAGPIMSPTTKTPYIRSGAPAPVTSNQVGLATTAPAASDPTHLGWLQYVAPAGARTFELVVYTRDDVTKPWTKSCSFGDGTLTTKAC